MVTRKLYTSLLLIVALLPAICCGDSNVLENPGFESGTTGWTSRSCSISSVTSPVYSGTRSARAYNRTDTWQGIQQNMINKMVEGETYQVSGYVRTSTSASSDVHISFQQTDGDGTNYNWAANGTADNTGWTQITGSFTLNVTGTLTELLVYVEGPASDVDIYIDDVVVYGPEVGPPDPNATGEINVSTRYQEIEGFGAAGAWYEGTLVSLGSSHPEIYDVLFGDLGLDIYRLRNAYDQSGGPGYMSDSSTIISNGEASLGRPLKVLISSWSPPDYLKSEGSTVGGTLAGGPSNYVYSDFADWWADSLTAWSSYGVDTDYISIQNEPDWEADWDTCRLEPTETSSYAGYDEAFEAVYDELYSRFGSSMPKMIGPEPSGFNGAAGSSLDDYLSEIDNHSHVYGYAHHLYNINAGENPDAYLSAMQNFNASWGSKPLFQTEYEKTTAAWPDALNIALLLHNSLAVEEVSGYIYWDLFWGTSGSGFVYITSSSYTVYNDYYGFMQYSAFIHSGWQRVDISDDSSDLRTSAYISPDNSQLSIVIINTSTDTDINLDLSFTGFSVGSGEIYRTSQTENCAYIGSFTNPITLPAKSITTVALASGVADETPPTPDPMSFASAPIATGPTSVIMTATTATDDSLPVRYYFECTNDASASSDWQVSSTYEAQGLIPDTSYTFRVKARDSSVAKNETQFSNTASAITEPPDLIPPEPDPMSWASPPAATGPTTITMTATTATDATSEPVEYYFECTNDVSASSEWQSSTVYIAQSLTPSTQYIFRVKARDSALAQNETEFSTTSSATTYEPPIGVGILGNWTTGTTHTKESGYNRAFVVIAHAEGNWWSTPSLSTVTYGGQTMTKITDIVQISSSEWWLTRSYVGAFILDEDGIDAAASDTISASWDGSPSSTSLTSVFLENVNQEALIGAYATNGVTNTDIVTTSALTTEYGDLVIDAATCTETGTYTVNNGFNKEIDLGVADFDGMGGYKSATGIDETPSVTHSTTTNRQALLGFVIQAGATEDYPPAAPTGLVATAGNDLVELDWDDNNEIDLYGYNVYRSMTSGSGYGKINITVVDDSNYTDNTVVNGTPYFYVVTAVDINDNESGYSDEATTIPGYQTCQDVLDGGYRLVSDINGDCYVDFLDVDKIALYWLDTNCASHDNCEDADLEPDGDVDFVDFSDFAVDWTRCNHPQDSNCPANW